MELGRVFCQERKLALVEKSEVESGCRGVFIVARMVFDVRKVPFTWEARKHVDLDSKRNRESPSVTRVKISRNLIRERGESARFPNHVLAVF
jgi:hypothetical protein